MAATVCEYAVPVVPAGRDVVVMVRGGVAVTTTMPRAWVLVFFAASVTVTLKLVEEAAVGVPVIAPVEALSVKPPGRDPDEMAQV